MAKYELELTNEQAESLYRMARGNPDFGVSWAEEFKPLIPIPVPTKIGAVVRTEPTAESSKFTTWILCQLPGLWFSPEDPNRNPYLTNEIGRIAAVLTPGISL